MFIIFIILEFLAMSHKYIEHVIRVLYADTDQMQVVWHGNYLRYFEAARIEFFRENTMSYNEFEENGYMLPVKEAFVDYKAPARNDNLIVVKVWIAALKNMSVKMQYEIHSKDDGLLLTKGYTLHPFVDKNGKLAKLPDRLYKVLKDAM